MKLKEHIKEQILYCSRVRSLSVAALYYKSCIRCSVFVCTELLIKLKCSGTLACAAQVHLPGDKKLFNVYFDTNAKYFKAFIII